MFSLSSARIAQLENQLVETSRKAEEQMNLSLDASSILQRSEYSEEDVEGLEKKIRKLTREVDMLRVEVKLFSCWNKNVKRVCIHKQTLLHLIGILRERLFFQNASLEKQIDAAHRSHLTSAGSTLSDRSGFIEGWRLQVNSLRVRTSRYHSLLNTVHTQ